MKKSIKKIFAVLMAVIMASTTLAIGSFVSFGAVTEYTAGPNIKASFDSSTGTLTLTGSGATYDFRNTDMTNPLTGQKLTRQTPWTENKEKITSVVVNEGITTIGEYCFYNCINLRNVSLPNSLKTIKGSGTSRVDTFSCFGAFRDCKSLETITLPANLEEIGDYTFRGCTALKTVHFPENLNKIGYCAFIECSSLSDVTIPNSVTSLGNCAFYDCTSIRTVTFGSGLSEVPVEAFYNDKNIKYINWNESIKTIGEWSFYNTGLIEVELPEHISAIRARAFGDCYFLVKAIVHNVDCTFADMSFNNSGFNNPQDFTVVGHSGSTAQTFAESHNYTFISLDGCIHANKSVNTVIAPTCTEKGRAETICNDCGQMVSSAEVDALGHKFDVLATRDDTDVDGHIRSFVKCSRCSVEQTNLTHVEAEGSSAYIKKYVWVDGYYTVINTGNCTTGVASTLTCSVEGCNAFEIANSYTAGHDVENWVVTKKATCTQSGVRSGHCSRCDKDVTEEIKPLGHVRSDIMVNEEDKTEEDGHIYEYYACKRCDSIEAVPVHVEWVELCYTPNVIVQETCVTEGRERDKCDICGETRDITIPNRGGHDYQQTSYEPATCTTKERTNYKCTKCGLTRSDTNDALGHDLYKPEGGSVLPTCTEDGYNTYECSRCSYSNKEVVKKLGHDSDPEYYKEVKAPTCEATGTATSKCRRCMQDYTMEVAALGHEYEDVKTEIADQPGHSLTVPTCIRCNNRQSATKTHDEWTEGKYTTSVVIEQNCITGKTLTDTCDYCGETRTYTEGEGLSHELRFITFVNTTGTLTYSCKICAMVVTASVADVYEMWDDECYNTVPAGRIAVTPSTYLDVNGDDYINAKDYAFLYNASKKTYETPTIPGGGEGGNGGIGDIIGGGIGDIGGGIGDIGGTIGGIIGNNP